MKNLLVLEPEKLEELPKRWYRNPNPRYSAPSHSRKWHWRDTYPYKKVYSFLKSNRGKPIDEVFSKYCNLEWLDKSFKNREWFGKNICLVTEMRDGKVWVQSSYGGAGGIFMPLDTTNWHSEYYYVHPQTRNLEYWHRSYIDYGKRREQEEAKVCRILGEYHQLLKLDGIWHEVKAEPVKSNIVVIDGRHWKVLNWPVIYLERSSEHVKGVERELLLPGEVKHGEHKGQYRIVDGNIAIPYVSYPPYWNAQKPPGPKDIMITDIDRWGSVLRGGWTFKEGIKVISSKQVGHKTLKKYGLRNDPPDLGGKKCKKCGGIIGKTCKYHWCPKCKKSYQGECKCY